MKLEILYLDDSYQEIIKTIDLNENIKYDDRKINTFYILSFKIEGENEDNAKVLSKTTNLLKEKFDSAKYYIVVNETSAYFNKRLYPLFNLFERLLRKVLFLVSAKNNNQTDLEQVKTIETLDFGKIYEVLFTSADFRKEVQSIVRNKNVFSKNEILKDISGIQEYTMWTRLFAEKYTFIAKNFLEIKSSRNDVMHAHNIDFEKYLNSFNLINKANDELADIESSILNNNLSFTSIILDNFRKALIALGQIVSSEMSETVKNICYSLGSLSLGTDSDTKIDSNITNNQDTKDANKDDHDNQDNKYDA